MVKTTTPVVDPAVTEARKLRVRGVRNAALGAAAGASDGDWIETTDRNGAPVCVNMLTGSRFRYDNDTLKTMLIFPSGENILVAASFTELARLMGARKAES